MKAREVVNMSWTPLRGTAAAVVLAAGLCIGFMPGAAADEWDQKTIVTFNEPVEVPGKALPAGTYVFKLLDSPSDRNIVQIWDKDEKHLLATTLAIPDYRLKPADKPVLMFEERPSGSPPALRAWFYPGDNFGQQFVYPHDRAIQLAKRTNQNVLSMRNEMANDMSNPATSPNASSVRELRQTDVTGVGPSGEPVDLTVVILEKPEK